MKKRNAADRIQEGLKLIEIKSTLKHGEWLGWLKSNREYSVATAQRFMREAKAQKPQAAAEDLAGAWASASMEERCRWLSEQGKMFDELWKRVRNQDAVMQRRGQAKGTYRYM